MTRTQNVIVIVTTTMSRACAFSWMGMTTMAALVALQIATSAHAEAIVNGPIDEVQVQARNSSVAEVLTALGAAHGLRYRTSVDLNRPVTGTFSGPVVKVISGLLKDYDYLVKSSVSNQIEVIIIKFRAQGANNGISTGASRYPPALFPANPPVGPSPVQDTTKGVSTGASSHPPKLFPANPPLGADPVQGSDKATSTGATPFPAALFPANPPRGPSPVQGTSQGDSTGASPYSPELFRPISPSQNPVAPAH